MTISVVIPTRNRGKLLEDTLQALCLQNTPQLLQEILVIDDGSTDSTQQIVESYQEILPIRYFFQPHLGVSTARNLGAGLAVGPLILFLDDDVVPGTSLIEEHVQFHQRHSDEHYALLGYVTWHPRAKATPFMEWYGEFGALFGYSKIRENQPISERFFYSCNISLKKRFFLANNGFNTNLTVLEDHEFGYRLAKAGMKLIFKRSAIGFHNQTFTFEQACARLRRYSPGLINFKDTEAGMRMVQRRQSLLFRTAERILPVLIATARPLLRLIDSDKKLPRAIYRLFYFHYGINLSFWAHADHLLASQPSESKKHSDNESTDPKS